MTLTFRYGTFPLIMVVLAKPVNIIVFGIVVGFLLSFYAIAEDEGSNLGGDSASSEGTASGESVEFITTPQRGVGKKAILDESIRYLATPEKRERMPYLPYDLPYEKGATVKLDSYAVYESNIYSKKDKVKDDYIIYAAPGAYFKYGNENNMFSAFYEAEQVIYTINTKETRLNQTVGGSLELFKGGKFQITIRDTLRRTARPSSSETTQYIERLPNRLVCKLKYHISPKSAIGFDYRQDLRHYLSSSRKEYSYIKNVFAPIFFWNLSPKLTLIGEYNMGFIDYYEGRPYYSSRFQELRLGAQGKLTPKSSLFLKTGYHYRQYYNHEMGTITKATGNKGAQWGPILEGIYRWTPLETTTFEIIAARHFPESVYRRFGFYTSTNLWVSANRRLADDVNASISGFYIKNEYPGEEPTNHQGVRRRHDSLYGFVTQTDYMFQDWLTLFFSYEFRYRDSNIRKFIYKNNIFSSGIKIKF